MKKVGSGIYWGATAGARSLPTIDIWSGSGTLKRSEPEKGGRRSMSGEYDDLKRRMEGAVAAFRHDLASLRTGRASSNLLDAIQVQAYGTTMPIHQVATVSVPDPRMVAVSVGDKSMVGAVDRAIRESNLGFNPIVDGTTLRIPLPELNEQR